MTVEEKVEACRVARAAVEKELIRVDRALKRLHLKQPCDYCCAPSGHPCRTRRGYERMHEHVGRMQGLSDRDKARMSKLYRQLYILRQALR